MFLENNFARPLFDFEKGGKPSAYKCLMSDEKDYPFEVCGKVTRTERGMRMHLKIVHGWEEQSCLSGMEQQIVHGSAEHRKQLRVSPKPKSEKPLKPTETKENKKSPETSEGELLKLMNGGN